MHLWNSGLHPQVTCWAQFSLRQLQSVLLVVFSHSHGISLMNQAVAPLQVLSLVKAAHVTLVVSWSQGLRADLAF